MSKTIDHATLCKLAQQWLRRPIARGGHGCQVVVREPKIAFEGGESPDAIGFRIGGPLSGSVVVECKSSRSDFLADRYKPHRQSGSIAMGRWRYYGCPAGLIQPEELPVGWGLLWFGRPTTVLVGAVCNQAAWTEFAQDPYDAVRETLLLANLLHRTQDAERVHERLRSAETQAQRLYRENTRLTQQNAQLQCLVAKIQGSTP